TSITVSVPPLSSGSTFVSGTVSVTVLQSSGQSNSMPLQIESVPSAPSLVPGTVALGFLQGALASANQLSTEITATSLSTNLRALINALNALIPPIQSVVNGSTSSANLGNFNGHQVVVRAAELTQVDRLLLALLQSLANSGGTGSSIDASSLPHSLRRSVFPLALAPSV